MPDTLHPPYGVFQPRVLQRWLDVNAQNGPLGRTRGFIQLPTFTITNIFLFPEISSDKIFQLNFTAVRNFSILMVPAFRTYLQQFEDARLAVYIVNIAVGGATDDNGNNIVTRYRLTENSAVNLDAPLYTGQVIYGGHFQIEFWSDRAMPTNTLVVPAINLLTSQRGNQDYRYGVDFAIHSLPIVQVQYANFANNNPNSIDLYNLPITYNLNTINGTN